jgi:hypothetical protein
LQAGGPETDRDGVHDAPLAYNDVAQQHDPIGQRGVRPDRGLEPPICRYHNSIFVKRQSQVTAVVDRMREIMRNCQRSQGSVGVERLGTQRRRSQIPQRVVTAQTV